MTPGERYAALFEAMVSVFGKKLPGFRVGYKMNSFPARVVAFLAYPLDPLYMEGRTSTWGRTTYFPSWAYVEADPRYACEVLAHEFVHACDRARGGWWRWWFPQLCWLPALGAVAGIWWRPALALLAFLAFALPIRSRGRADLEARGFAASMAFQFWTTGGVGSKTKAWMVDQLSGPGLYWPASRLWAEATVETYEARIRAGEILFGEGAEPYRALREILVAANDDAGARASVTRR